MTPDRLREVLVALNLKQYEAAKFLDVDQRTITRWVTGAKPIPDHTAMLLEVMVAKGLTPTEVEDITFEKEEIE